MSLAVGALVFVATVLIRQLGGLEALELQAYDAYVEYECGKARGFNITGWPTTEYLPSTIGMRCNDMEQWIYEAPATSSVTSTP